MGPSEDVVEENMECMDQTFRAYRVLNIFEVLGSSLCAGVQ